MSDLARDSRLALRLLRRNPGFTAIVILTLALGIGADTAIFSVVKATLLDPLPYAEPHRLTYMLLYDSQRPDNLREVSYPDYRDWRAEAESFAGLAAIPTSLGRVFLERGGSLQPVRGLAVSANLFEVFRVAPLYGRVLLPEDDAAGAAPVAVIGHGLWRRAFGADPAAIGTTVELDGTTHTVVGVMPPGFEYPPGAEVWTAPAPATAGFAENRSVGFLQLVGRLAPGASADAARQELEGLIETVSKPQWPAGVDADVSIIPLREHLLDLRIPLTILLGAGGPRLMRQLLTESLVLALAGGALGTLLAAAGTGALTRLRDGELFRVGQADMDAGVLLFALALSLVTATRSLGLRRRGRAGGRAWPPG
jgi:hypothetical protein